MEEKEVKKDKQQKLSYEQLEAYANQTAVQAQRIIQENKNLVKENERLRNQINLAEINLAFKVLEFKDNFDPEFVAKITARLQEVLTPTEQEKSENKE